MFPRIVVETPHIETPHIETPHIETLRSRPLRIRTDTAARQLRLFAAASFVALLCSFVAYGSPAQLAAQAYDDSGVRPDEYGGIEARLWFDRGADPVVDRGERLRIYYRVSEDAYTAVFHIDTDGHVRLVFPRSPDQEYRLRAERDYRLLFDGSSYWRVSEHPGRGYFFIVASATPLDFSNVHYSSFNRDWDLHQIGSEVYRDPYLAMDDYVATLIPDWEYGDYGLDVSEYSVGSSYEYPRFMCYECHDYRPYTAWNPYYAACTSFRVVIWDDPFYFPYYSGRYYSTVRYPANRIVYNGRRFAGRPRFEFKERGGDESSQPIVIPRTNPGESAPRRRTTGGGVVNAPSRGGSIVDDAGRTGGSVDARRRDQSGVSGGATTDTRQGSPVLRGTSPRNGSSDAARRPVLERRTPTDGVRTRPSSPARPPAARGTSPRNTTTRGRVIRPGDNQGGVLRGSQRSGSATSGSTGSVRERSTVTRGRVIRPNADRRGAQTRAAPTRNAPTRAAPGRATSGRATSGAVARPPARSSGSGAVTRAPTRSSGSRGSVTRPPSRSGGASARNSGGSRGSSGRVQVRRRGGGV